MSTIQFMQQSLKTNLQLFRRVGTEGDGRWGILGSAGSSNDWTMQIKSSCIINPDPVVNVIIIWMGSVVCDSKYIVGVVAGLETEEV